MYYADLRLIPSEVSDSVLMSMLMQRLHPYFVETAGVVGASFPMLSGSGLGSVLRLQSADPDSLHAMPEVDFALRGGVGEVPADATSIRVKRVQLKSSAARIAKRYAKRHQCSIDEAMKRYDEFSEQRTALPFFSMTSQSSGQQFRVFVACEDSATRVAGKYSSYGLSNAGSTVLCF